MTNQTNSGSLRGVLEILLSTLVRGVFFLVPIILIALVAREGYRMIVAAFRPLTRWLPEDRVLGLLAEDLAAISALTILFLLAGLFVATRPGRSLSDRLERMVLYRVPGYLMVRGAAGGFPGLRLGQEFNPVLVETGEGWAFALLVERGDTGFSTIFLPDSPTPTSGSVRIIESSRVRPLDASVLTLLGCLTRSGVGAVELSARVLGKAGRAESDSRAS